MSKQREFIGRFEANPGELDGKAYLKANQYTEEVLSTAKNNNEKAVKLLGPEAAAYIGINGQTYSMTNVSAPRVITTPHSMPRTIKTKSIQTYKESDIASVYAGTNKKFNLPDLTPEDQARVTDYIRHLQSGHGEYKEPDLNKLHGQVVPKNVGMAYIKDPGLNIKHAAKDDMPIGAGRNIRPMPLPEAVDPESGLSDTDIKRKQSNTGKGDDPSMLEHAAEEMDPTGITYGTAAKPYKVKTYPPKYGLQRSPPSSYKEEDEDLEEILDELIKYNIDVSELHMGLNEEKEEHGMSDEEAIKTAFDHLKKNPKYYSKLKKAGL